MNHFDLHCGTQTPHSGGSDSYSEKTRLLSVCGTTSQTKYIASTPPCAWRGGWWSLPQFKYDSHGGLILKRLRTTTLAGQKFHEGHATRPAPIWPYAPHKMLDPEDKWTVFHHFLLSLSVQSVRLVQDTPPAMNSYPQWWKKYQYCNIEN